MMDIFERIQARRAFLLNENTIARAAIEAIENELSELAEAERTLTRLAAIPRCPSCAGTEIYTYKSRRIFKCKTCGKQFSATSATPLRHHKMPVEKYERARAMIRCGATATDLTRQLGIGYKTALGMKHRTEGRANG